MSYILVSYLIGLAILAVAIILNIVAKRLSIKTWHDLAEDPKSVGKRHYIWLLIFYPLLLGLVAVMANKILA